MRPSTLRAVWARSNPRHLALAAAVMSACWCAAATWLGADPFLTVIPLGCVVAPTIAAWRRGFTTIVGLLYFISGLAMMVSVASASIGWLLLPAVVAQAAAGLVTMHLAAVARAGRRP